MSIQFNHDGFLSPQDYPMTIGQLQDSLLVRGPDDGSPWNRKKRLILVNNLSIIVNQLHRVDESGNEQMFPAAFRKTRDTFLPKGIIQIIK